MEKNSKKNQPSPPDSSASKKDPKKDEEVGEPGSENKKSRFSKLKERISQKNETDPKSSNEENKGASPKGSKDVKKDLKAQDEKKEMKEKEPKPPKEKKEKKQKEPKPPKDKKEKKQKEPKEPEEKSPIKERMKELWSDFKLNVRYYGNLFIGRNPDKKKGVKPLVPTKKFAGIIAIFLLMNFFLIQSIQSSDPDSFLYKLSLFMTFNKPFSVVVAASFMFFQYGILITNEKAKQWIYGDKSYLKQLLIIPSMFAINFFIVDALISVGVDFSYLLGILTAVWLVILSVRLYGASRGVATTIESKWVNVYSPIRYAGAILTPWFIVILLTALSWGYRYFLVLLTLDFLGPRVPFEAFEVYKDLMRIILPFVYISLIFIFTMILFETILTSKQRDQSTRRAGVFDNLTFALITFVMFIFLLYQITLFLVLSPRSVAAVRSLAGNNTGTGAFVFLEFGISMIFLFRIVKNMNKQYPYGVIFFNQEGSLMLFLALVFCQTGSRIGLYYNENLQDTIINLVISYKNLVIPMIIIIVLGLTIVLYYFKPRDTSIFLRTAKDAVSELDNFSETVLKFCRREYIRRGKAFYFSEIEGSLSDVLGLPDEEFINILYNLKKQYVDLQIHEVNYEGKRDYEIDFYSITENFGYESREKALAYLRKQFYTYVLDRSHKKPRRTTVVAKTKFVIPEQDTRVIKYYKKKAKEEEKRKKREEKEEAKRRKKEGLPPLESVKKEEPKKDEMCQKQIQETKVKQEEAKRKQDAEKEEAKRKKEAEKLEAKRKKEAEKQEANRKKEEAKQEEARQKQIEEAKRKKLEEKRREEEEAKNKEDAKTNASKKP